MRILFACHRLPYPPKRGGKIRPFNIIRHLTDSGHRVTVGSLARSAAEAEEGSPLKDHCDKVLVGRVGKVAAVCNMLVRLPSPVPSSMGFFYSASLHRLMREELRSESYDLLFVHCSSAAQYVKSANGVPSILDFGDMDSQKWLDYSSFKRWPLSLGYWLEGRKLEREEKRLAAAFTTCTATTRGEFETLNGYRAANSTGWFPNGVDAAFFDVSDRPYAPDSICFIGRMDYFPNQQAMLYFCAKVLPAIQARRPATKLTIVGASPSSEIRDLAKLNGVEVTGTVDDVRPYVQSAALTVAPLLIARGTQNKILESMAMGVPVVASAVAAGGVDAVPGEHMLVAKNDDEYVDHVLSLLDDPGRRERLSRAGRARVLACHDWSASLARLDEIIQSTVDGAN